MPQFLTHRQVQIHVSVELATLLFDRTVRPFQGFQRVVGWDEQIEILAGSLLPWKRLQCSRNCSMLMP